MNCAKHVAAFALAASQIVTGQADAGETNTQKGWFGSVGYESDPNTYKIKVPTSLFAPENALNYLPPFVGMNINSSDCAYASAGYRWNGGSTNPGDFSWSFSTSIKSSACNANIKVEIIPIKTYSIGKISEALYGTIHTTMNNSIPQEVFSFADMYGIDVDGFIDQSATTATDYIMDPSAWLPTANDTQLVFNQIPTTSNPNVTTAINDARNVALDITNKLNRVRGVVNKIYALPDHTQGNGKIFALSLENSLKGKYHFSRKAYVFAGLDFNAVARASFHGQPFASITETPDIIVPFGGFDGATRIGFAFQDVFGDFDIAASYNHPFSQFWVPVVDGVTLEETTKPYLGLEAIQDNGSSFGITYTPSTTTEKRQYGAFIKLTF